MIRPLLARVRLTTMLHSTMSVLVMSSLFTSACAPGIGPRSAANADEAPAPHLRAAASDAHEDAAAAHTDPAPHPASGPDVSLGGILAYSDLNSPVLAVARSTRSRAAAARAAAAPLLLTNPELSVAVGPRMGEGGTGLDVQASLTQQIQIAGERAARISSAERMREMTEAEIEQMRWSVHCDVHAEFHRALMERERVRLAERVVSFQQEVLRTVDRQISAGEAAPLTLRLARAEVAQAQQILVGAQQAYIASRIRLAQLSGWPAATPPIPEGTADVPREPAPIERLLAVARERLPSLRAAEARVREADARVNVADRDAWPKPSIGVQYNREGNPSPEGHYDIVMGVVSVPLPTFQRNQGDRGKMRAEAIVAAAEFAAAGRLLEGQIAEARSQVVAAAQRTHAYGTEVLPRFEENLTLLRRAFELGEIEILALSTGRERFLRIQSDALAAQLDYFVALAGLERVVGVDLWRDDHHHDESNP